MDRATGLAMDQRVHGNFRADSFVPSRGLNIVQPNISTMATSSLNSSNIDSHYVLDACDNIMIMNGMTQSNGTQHQHDLNTGFRAAPNLYYGRNPSFSTGALPLPQNHGVSGHLSRFSAPNVHQSSIDNSSLDSGIHYYASSDGRNRRFPHSSRHQNLDLLTLPMPVRRGHSIIYHPTATAPSYQLQSNLLHNAAVLQHDSSEVHSRHAGPVPHTGRQMYRRNRRGLPRTTLGHGNFRPMELAQVDGVVVLVNHYRDTEFRVEDMSYEGLNALGQQIGHVSTGLTEEIITNQMKTKAYLMAASAVNLEEATSQEVEADLCVICQDEYKNQDMIGVLQCGHEYHADCLRKWLLVRNVCPLCKSEALIPGGEIKDDTNQQN